MNFQCLQIRANGEILFGEYFIFFADFEKNRELLQIFESRQFIYHQDHIRLHKFLLKEDDLDIFINVNRQLALEDTTEIMYRVIKHSIAEETLAKVKTCMEEGHPQLGLGYLPEILCEIISSEKNFW
jgi:hypothetical protein